MIDNVNGYSIGEISPEQFVADHTFCYIIRGVMRLFDGNKMYTLRAGECCIARKNQLIRFMKEKVDNELEKVFVFFDEAFLRKFEERHYTTPDSFENKEAILKMPQSSLLSSFITSLLPFYRGGGVIDAPFANIKREELLLILIQQQNALASIFFDYGIPQKINLEEFMQRNFRFNVSLERFAYLSGRSLSAFKRDFKQIFNDAPNRWIIQRRLKEAHFLIEKKNKKPSDIYFELGFETLSHFSYTFKKKFGYPPSQIK